MPRQSSVMATKQRPGSLLAKARLVCRSTHYASILSGGTSTEFIADGEAVRRPHGCRGRHSVFCRSSGAALAGAARSQPPVTRPRLHV